MVVSGCGFFDLNIITLRCLIYITKNKQSYVYIAILAFTNCSDCCMWKPEVRIQGTFVACKACCALHFEECGQDVKIKP